MADLSTQDQQQINQLIASDPQIQQAIAQAKANFRKAPNRAAQGQVIAQLNQQIAPILQQKGVTLPQGYGFDINGQVGHDTWFEKNAPWLVPAALGGAAAATSLIGAGTSAAGAGGAAGGTLPSTATTSTVGGLAPAVTPVTDIAAGTTTAAAGGGSAAAGGGFGAALKSIFGGSLGPSIIGAGASLGGAAIASHGATEAAKIAAAEQDKALAQAKAIYDANVARQKPFVDLGTSALGPLAFGMGLPAPAAAPPAPSTGVAAGAVDAQGKPLPGAAQAPYVTPPTMAQQTSLSQLGQPVQAQVKVLNPSTGQIHLIPPDQVAAAQQQGGQVVT